MKKIFVCLLFAFVLAFSSRVLSIFPIGIARSFDIEFDGVEKKRKSLGAGLFGEIMLNAKGHNPDADKVDVLQLWQETQSSLAMLKGFSAGSPMEQLLRGPLAGFRDNGRNGHLKPSSNFKWSDVVVSTEYKLPKNFRIAAHVPIYFSSLDNVVWEDMTPNAHAVIKNNLTNDIADNVKNMGKTLDINGWSRIGIGDISLMGHWNRFFPQFKPWLRNVEVALKGGLSIPTGLKANEDKILSVPFGLDGSAGMIFGGDLNLYWFDYLKGGIKAEFLYQFGNSKERRIKTHADQTDLFLLEKVYARKEFGFTQHFALNFGVFRVLKGAFLNATFDHWRHGDDSLTIEDNSYSSATANTAISLEEWSLNTLQLNAGYDFGFVCSEDSRFIPKISIFCKLPLKARRAVLGNVFGLQLNVKF